MKYQILLLFILIGYAAQAQNLTLGPEVKGDKYDIIADIILADDTGFYALRNSVKAFALPRPIIEKYNNDFEQIYSVSLDEFDKKGVNAQEVFTFQNRIFVAGSDRDKKTKNIEYFVQEVSKETGELIGERKSVGSDKPENFLLIAGLDVKISHDGSKLAMLINDFALSIGITDRGGKKDKSTGYDDFTMKVFDAELKEIQTKNVTLPYNKDLLQILRFDVDNEGNIYLLTRFRSADWREKRKAKQAYFTYKILAYRNEGIEVKEYDVTLDEKYISDITFDLDQNNNLICAGFFSERFRSEIAGTFFFSIDAETKKIRKQDTKKFDTAELSLFMKERSAEKGKEIDGSFALEEFILRPDGGVVLIAESFFTTSKSTSNGAYKTIYNYGPIMIVNISSEGKIDWVTNISKKQKADIKDYTSYATAIKGDEIFLIFNEGLAKKSNVMAASVDAKGEVSKKELFNVKDEKLLLRVPGCQQISDDEMIVYGEWQKKFRFGKLKF